MRIYKEGKLIVFAQDNGKIIKTSPPRFTTFVSSQNLICLLDEQSENATGFLAYNQIFDKNGALYGNNLSEVVTALNAFIYTLPSTNIGNADTLEEQSGSYYLSRSNHTGSQPISSVTNLQTTLNGKANVVHAHVKADITDFAHTHPQSEITNLVADLASKAGVSHVHVIADIMNLQTTLDGKASTTHTHIIAEVSGLQTALDGKAGVSHTHLKADITDFAHTHPQSEITNLVADLASKAGVSHVHVIADITNLQTTLDGKASTTHTHIIAEVSGLQTALDGKAGVSHTHVKADITDFAHTHPQSEITNLVADLASKAGVSHVHVIADITNLQTTLDGKASIAHTHIIAEVSGLQTALDGKAGVSHTHVKADITDFAHTHPQSEITDLVSDLASKINTSSINTANGVLGLNASNRIANAYKFPHSLRYRRHGTGTSRYISASINALAPATGALTANVLRAFPMIVPIDVVLNELRSEVSTSVASTQYRLGIYTDNGSGYPASLVASIDIGTYDSGATGVKSNVLSSVSLSEGLYWVAYCANGAPTLRSIAVGSLPLVLGYPSTMGSNSQGTGWTVAYTYAALPASYPVGATVLANTVAPLVLLGTT